MNEAPGLRRKPTTYVNHLLTPHSIFTSLIPVSMQLDYIFFFYSLVQSASSLHSFHLHTSCHHDALR